MALIRCGECGREISDRASACVYCGCSSSETKLHSDTQQVYNAASAQQGAAASPAPMRRARRQQMMNASAADEGTERLDPFIQQMPVSSAAHPSSAAQQAPTSGSVRQVMMVNGDVRQIVSSVTPNSQANADDPVETFIRNIVEAPADQRRIAAFKKKRKRKFIMKFIFPVLFLAGIILGMKYPTSISTPILVTITLMVYPAIWNVISIIASLIGTKTDKSIKRLEARGLMGKALKERERGSFTPFGDHAVLTDHFIFRKNKSADIMIACDDVVWVYTSYFRRYYSLMLGTKHMGKVTLSGVGVKLFKRNHKQLISDAIVELRRRNPTILIGDTAENKAKYKNMREK